MEGWAASFHEKSERRRRASRRAAIRKWTIVTALLTAAIAAGFWLVTVIVDLFEGF